jgi:DNA repair protein RadC
MFQVKINVASVRESKGKKKVTTPVEVYNACSDMANFAQEAVVALCLDVKNKIISKNLITLGLSDQSLVHPREVFRNAITENASSIIMVHNHPTGETSPSPEDLRITRQMIDAGRIIGIRVLDHVIIGRSENDQQPFRSLRESGFVTFDS